MVNQESILDYASPRKRSRMRLPASSVLLVGIERDRIRLTETLMGKIGAVCAIVFACLTMLVTACQIAIPGAMGPGRRDIYEAPVAVALCEVGVMLMLIHQTWRKTLLLVRHDELLISFSSPFYRKHYRWTGDEIADMLVVITANAQSAMPLAELLITRVGGGEAHLFTDHPGEEIYRIVRILLPMLRDGERVEDNDAWQHSTAGPTPMVDPGEDPWVGPVQVIPISRASDPSESPRPSVEM